MSRYRRLRGMAIHVMPYLRTQPMRGNAAIFLTRSQEAKLAPRTAGKCAWCRLPLAPSPPGFRRRRHWDDDCEAQYLAVLGKGVSFAAMKRMAKEYSRCLVCGHIPGEGPRTVGSYGLPDARWLEVDQIYPIHEGVSAGAKGIVRAFLLENFGWYCHVCRAAKTNRELHRRGEQIQLERKFRREQKPPDPPAGPVASNGTLFDLAQYEMAQDRVGRGKR